MNRNINRQLLAIAGKLATVTWKAKPATFAAATRVHGVPGRFQRDAAGVGVASNGSFRRRPDGDSAGKIRRQGHPRLAAQPRAAARGKLCSPSWKPCVPARQGTLRERAWLHFKSGRVTYVRVRPGPNDLWRDVMFTLLRNGGKTKLDTVLEVVRVARPDDAVYVSGRGWMTVGDLSWDMDSTARDGVRSGAVDGQSR